LAIPRSIGREDQPSTEHPKSELRLVIPARNEETRIVETVLDCCRRFGARARITVVANDCSDNTASVVRGLMASNPNLELVETHLAIGKGGAVRVGLARGNEPYVAFLDADGSASAATLDHLLERLRAERAAAAIGSRWLPASKIVQLQSVSRRIASRGFNLLVRALFALPYSDTQCGAKVFRRDAIVRVLDSLELSNFAFDVDVLVSLRAHGYRVIEEPITWGDAPGTSIRLWPAALSMALSIVRLRVRRSPLRHWPFTDLLARDTVVAVVPTTTLLLLGYRGAPRSARLDAIAEELRRAGHRTIEPDLSSFAKRVRFWVWYALRGHVAIGAIVNEDPATLLARFSTKAKVSLKGDPSTDRAAVQQLLERLRYRAVLRRADELSECVDSELSESVTRELGYP
jgi:hypothetical protein